MVCIVFIVRREMEARGRRERVRTPIFRIVNTIIAIFYQREGVGLRNLS